MRSDADRLGDVLDAIEKIRERISDDIAAFLADEMVQVWVIDHLQVIGEASRRLSQGLRERHSEVPWSQMIALRNILVHEYFGLNLEQVWTMAQKDLPPLEEQVRLIRSSIPTCSGPDFPA